MTDGSTDPAQRALSKIDTSAPQSARIWNYWLGGKDNYEVDRAAGDAFKELFPGIEEEARASRYFLVRAVRFLAGERGIRQFLDVGTGLPTVDNTHEVAQRVAPDARVVYVDNDPLVLAHAQALLTSTTPEGSTLYIDADLREPERILEAAREALDFTRPVALMLMGILGLVEDHDEACSIVRRLMAGLPSGSYLVHYDGGNTNEVYNEATRRYNEISGAPYILRSPEQIARYYDGLELVEPGVVSCSRWRLDFADDGWGGSGGGDGDGAGGLPPEVNEYGGVARKP
ncbi:SAM-dependent methyltransferase [Streptomyces sp. CA-288835]|uniref:SAM-dependent methyltransferase n=1 Tax=Streptomyces sp. CA-288835 TaxID=3240069 RepID=UPI003D93AB5A